ncbi:uncharacterized protein LOC100908848 [Galendromus occidentalis]|uniref:Uncharacterized protein LOC100908848 n=1 Tax=Galendromus occidentalis TaxID=34638 RepID=A0AAJ6QX67_9ACAR|nr:uncharacterized protein LOC100908848 [Galendromus occidentalis]
MAKLLSAVLVLEILWFSRSKCAADLRVRSGEFVKCPPSHSFEHGSLRVVSQDDVDVNAVYVKFGRPALQILRRFVSARDAQDIVDSRLLNFLDRSKPVYLVDNSMNLNGTRCDIICCRTEKGALAFEESAGFSDSCSRLEVDDGARCEVKWLERISQGVCQSQNRRDATNERWVECQASIPPLVPFRLSQQPLESHHGYGPDERDPSVNVTRDVTSAFKK